MDNKTITQIIDKNTALLLNDKDSIPFDGILPSIHAIEKIMTLCKSVIFPYLLHSSKSYYDTTKYQINIRLEEVYRLLIDQLHCGFCLANTNSFSKAEAENITLRFIDSLPGIKSQLINDAKAIQKNDPAANSIQEVVFCYPSIIALTHYRIAHTLFKMNIPIIPRIITEMAHSRTGIDIHPAAKIGDCFSIDHGTGVVIGATCIIGNRVSLYQGVTLGAKKFVFDDHGTPLDTPRHPIIEDDVVIYSNASILGNITIGHDSIIGSNIRLTESVPPHSKITHSQPF